MHTSAHTVKVEQISHKTGTLWQCEINQREQGRVFFKKKFQDLHVGSLLGRLHGLLQNTADTETVDTTEDIGSGHSVTDTLALPKTHGTPWEGQDTTLGGVCRLTHVFPYSL